MSATAASLTCPICAHAGVFDSVQSLRDRLIYVSTNKMLCPVCQEEVVGLDKLTIHLFSHVKLLTSKNYQDKQGYVDNSQSPKENKQASIQQKKTKSGAAKSKAIKSTANDPIKYVKIFPKLPVISLNTVPVIDISQRTVEECVTMNNLVHMPTLKTDTTILRSNTTCDVCGLQFVDTNILKMHKCLIHNLDDDTNKSFTRYECHVCPKHFKMRGSLMVHLRVAHYGFISGNDSNNISKTVKEESPGSNVDQFTNDNAILEKNDNKQWQCDVCQKCFTTKYFLKKHKRLHTGETPYACSQCNKTFTFQQSYHKHLLYHNDEKPHTCNFCGRAFKELSTLHNHQRIHTGEKPFSCETCGKSFRQRVSYLVHRRIHTGVMPYKCTACEKSFRYKVSQRTHKCPAKPPGIVIRQSGDLVEKLKKKNKDPDSILPESYNNTLQYSEVSEANAALVRSGAKLSLEDMESDSFKLISEPFIDNINIQEDNISDTSYPIKPAVGENNSSVTDDILNSNIEDLIDSLPMLDKNVPSPSEILKNLCLSQEDNYSGNILDQNSEKPYDLYKVFNDFM
ncbi:zinc finger protein 62 homolog isoform X1 [Plodia interpunctella]|uniref:zinc finger protein 62 homolog isoform X1 n=1 Tax=Plodia interpunctella TaxID=58824 RepID=UPI0023683394|nr:zinc finger protein 62 homolog isoform X1 [Plodia interpunctella]